MSAIETNENVPSADHPSVNIDPDFHLPVDQGNGFVRAFRILFPKAA
ncbi:hypothetical protein AB0N64_09340 [Microbacterium sp. NPDC089318]